MPLEAWRRVLGEQQIIATYEPEEAVATLPRLLAQPEDRKRLRTLLDRLANDAMFRRQGLTTGQRATFDRERKALGQPARAARDGLKRSDRTATVR
jgi:hypothetical protein